MLIWQTRGDDDTRIDLVSQEDPFRDPYGTVRVHAEGAEWSTDFPPEGKAEGTSETILLAKEEVERRMMCYPLDTTKPANGRYTDEPQSFGETMLVRRFRKRIQDGDFTDDDGHARPMCNGKLDSECLVLASKLDAIPEDATHVQWYNK